MIDAIFFDIDDTLVDHVTAMRAATVELHRIAASSIPLEQFMNDWKAAHAKHYPRFLRGEASYNETVMDRVRESIDARLTDTEVTRLFDGYLASYERAWRLFDDVTPCLARFEALRLGVISNGRSAEQQRKLDKLGVRHHFDRVFISEDVGVAKPHVEIFHRACRAVGAPPSNVMYVGDHFEIDVLGSRNAGLQPVWLNRTGLPAPDGAIPTVKTLDELSESPCRVRVM